MKGQTVHLPKRAWRLGLFFIGILLAGGVLLMYKGNDAVAQGIANKDGILTAEQVKVSFQSVSGKMVNEAVQESQEVKAGDILMQLDSTDVDLDIAKTQAQIAQLDAQIQSMEGTYRHRLCLDRYVAGRKPAPDRPAASSHRFGDGNAGQCSA